MADVIREVMGADNLRFERTDLFTLDPAEAGTFDVTLFLGVLYHLADPVGAPKVVRKLCRGICVIETQVARGSASLDCLWGSGESRSGPGVAVVRPDAVHVGEGHNVVLVPTLPALFELLHAVGFRHVSLAVASQHEFQQFVDHDRVVVFALV